MQENRRSNERSHFSIPLYGRMQEAAFKALFFYKAKRLIFSLLLMGCMSHSLNAQISNELVFDSLVCSQVQKKEANIGYLTGFLTNGIQAKIDTTNGGKDSLEIETPMVNFSKLSDGRYLRNVETDVIFKTPVEERFHLSHSDTLNRKDLRAVRATKLESLKGEHPGNVAKFLWPTLGLGAGVGIVLSLFYIRS